MLAVAGAGKTYHICHAIDPTKKILILAYTHENIHNIQKELCDANGCVPELTTVMTFHAFVYHHLILPYEPSIKEHFALPCFTSKGICMTAPPQPRIPDESGQMVYNPEYRKKELESEAAGWEAYLKKTDKIKINSEHLLNHPEYGKLLAKNFRPLDKELERWQEEPYEKCTKHPENLLVQGTHGKMLRSKSEAIIDRALYQNKIPFHYEEKLILDGIMLYPDFVMRHPFTGQYFYWEHFGMMDNPDYCNHACDKIKLYCRHGIIPSVNLILTYETKI